MASPDRNLDLLQFAEQHVPTWRNATTAIGLTNPQVDEYALLTSDARATYDAAIAARNAAKIATRAQNDAFRALRNNNSALVRLIRGFAADSGNESKILQNADLPPIKPPSPFLRPNAPTNLTANLAIAAGGIEIKWKWCIVLSGRSARRRTGRSSA